MCLCLGPARSGKTLLMKQLQGGDDIDDASHTVPTNGINLFTIRSSDGRFDIIVREIGGSMAPIWKHYFDRVRLLILGVQINSVRFCYHKYCDVPAPKGAECIQVHKVTGGAVISTPGPSFSLILLMWTRIAY